MRGLIRAGGASLGVLLLGLLGSGVQAATSSTGLAVSGVPGNYSLTATVTGTGGLTPSGTVQFKDVTNGGSVIASATLNPATQTSSYGSPQGLATDNNPYAISVADLNGDGVPDMAVATNVGYVDVLLGTGSGGFAGKVSYATGSAAWATVVRDFNGDGKQDIAVTVYGSNVVNIFLGNGNGTFGAPAAFSVGSNPTALAAGDFNGDGRLDLATANYVGDSVSILLGNGDGTFQAATNYGAGNSPYGLALGDFNGDGRADLVVASIMTSSISVLLGNGNGSFQAPITYASSVGATSDVTVADFNGDGHPDFAVAGSTGVAVFLNPGSGSFGAPLTYTAGTTPYALTAADMNLDGVADLVVANVNSSNFSVLVGQGDGSFSAATQYPLGVGASSPQAVAVADFDQDGRPDIAVADGLSNQVLLFKGQVSIRATANGVLVPGSGTHQVVATYGGDSHFITSTSSPQNLTASMLTSHTAVSGSPNPSQPGTVVNVVAQVTGAGGSYGAPTGSVRFTVSGAGAAGPQVVTLNGSGQALFSFTPQAVGQYTVAANYQGDGLYDPSTATFDLTASPLGSQLTLASSPNPAEPGQAVTITAQVGGAGGGATAPTGSVRFTVSGAGAPGPQVVALDGSGRAVFSFTPPGNGLYTVAASYSGDGLYDPASATLVQSVAFTSVPGLGQLAVILLGLLLATLARATRRPAMGGRP